MVGIIGALVMIMLRVARFVLATAMNGIAGMVHLSGSLNACTGIGGPPGNNANTAS